jgi:hypothetical protein
VKPVAEPVEIRRAEPDLIDRIAAALPEEVRAEYYKELRHCRSLPESDEMLRLLRAMQFLVLLIEQAPTRVAEERERLDKLLAAAVANVTKATTASETYHSNLQRKLARLPADIANGISPEAIAEKMNDHLRQEFIRSTIPQVADDLTVISDHMKNTSLEFSKTSDTLGNSYRGAAEDARKAIASLNAEMSQATATATKFTAELNQKFSKAWRLSQAMLVGGALIIGLAIGMMFERFLFTPTPTVIQQVAPVTQPAQNPPPAPKTATR